MSFIYPRTLRITRPERQGGAGLQPYLSEKTLSETLVVDGVPASIQLRREGTDNKTGLPADAKSPLWDVMIPRWAGVVDGTVLDRDIVTDDLNRRFQVVADYADSLGPNFRVQRLET